MRDCELEFYDEYGVQNITVVFILFAFIETFHPQGISCPEKPILLGGVSTSNWSSLNNIFFLSRDKPPQKIRGEKLEREDEGGVGGGGLWLKTAPPQEINNPHQEINLPKK